MTATSPESESPRDRYSRLAEEIVAREREKFAPKAPMKERTIGWFCMREIEKLRVLSFNVDTLVALFMLNDLSGDFGFAVTQSPHFLKRFKARFDEKGQITEEEIIDFLRYRGMGEGISDKSILVEPVKRIVECEPEKYSAIMALWEYTGDMDYAYSHQLDFRASFKAAFDHGAMLIPEETMRMFVRGNK